MNGTVSGYAVLDGSLIPSGSTYSSIKTYLKSINLDYTHYPNFTGRFPYQVSSTGSGQTGGQTSTTLSTGNIPQIQLPKVGAVFDSGVITSNIQIGTGGNTLHFAYSTAEAVQRTVNEQTAYMGTASPSAISTLPSYIQVHWLIKL